jgi:hypothetical protein
MVTTERNHAMKNMTLLALSFTSLLAGKIAYADDNDA